MKYLLIFILTILVSNQTIISQTKTVTYKTVGGLKTATFTGTGELEYGSTEKLKGATVAIIRGYSYIRSHAFEHASGLTTVKFEGNTLKYINDYAFQNTPNLTSIVIPSSVIEMGDMVFNQSGLTSITFEANSQLTTIGMTFAYASKLTSIVIPPSVTKISYKAFEYSGLKEVSINLARLGEKNWPVSVGTEQTIGGKTGVNVVGY